MKTIIETVNHNEQTLRSLPTAYHLKACEVMELIEDTGNEISEPVMNAIRTAYAYGLLKGRRYEQNRK